VAKIERDAGVKFNNWNLEIGGLGIQDFRVRD
jgi:hypothetical protein